MFNGLDPARANTRGARWNPPGVAAIYTSLDRDTAIAEADYAIARQPFRPHVTRQLYQIRLALLTVVDLSDAALLGDVGVFAEELASPNHAACQSVGGACHWLGADGILVPSARTNIGTNLVVYADRMDIDAPFAAVDREDLI
ncbi:MAG TPA: RES family NAD+ phosphorylase [Acidimicrobiia bacterium]|nr:RES family NAD+ phosphorylase [Acidimicrobiia bacterium]